MNKISIRFYNNKEVRAIWDDENAKWWFSIVDIIAAITQSPRPRKYQNALKTKLKSREMFMKGIDYSYYYEKEGHDL